MKKFNFIKAIPPKLAKDMFGMYQDSPIRVGWHGDMDRCWIDNDNNICVSSRLIKTQFGNVEHVAISRGEGTTDGSGDISWADKMEIKNTLFGENRFAIEVFPKQKNLIDTMDVYHLWVFDKKVEMPFGLTRKEYNQSPTVNRGYSMSQADLLAMKADYERVGKM